MSYQFTKEDKADMIISLLYTTINAMYDNENQEINRSVVHDLFHMCHDYMTEHQPDDEGHEALMRLSEEIGYMEAYAEAFPGMKECVAHDDSPVKIEVLEEKVKEVLRSIGINANIMVVRPTPDDLSEMDNEDK